MQVRKLWKIGVCLTLALSLFTLHDQGINASNNTKEIKSLEMKLYDDNGILKLNLKNNDSLASSIKISFVKVGDASRLETAEFYYEQALEEGVDSYKSNLSLKGIEKGSYLANSIVLIDQDSNEIKLDRSCTAETTGNAECTGYSTLLDGKWEDLKIEGTAEIVYPSIKSIKGSGFEKNVDLMNHKFRVEAELNEPNMDYMINFVYDSDKTSELGAVSLTVMSDDDTMSFNQDLRYKGENFTLAYIQVVSNTDTGRCFTIYSSKSRAELENYIPDNYSYAYYDINEIATKGQFDFSIQNYMEDVTPPELISADWDVNEVSLPGKANFNFEVRDTESNYNSMELLLSEDYFFASGGDAYDGKGNLEFIFSRYHNLEPVQVYGLKLSDNAGNEVYYLCDMDAYDKDMNKYHGKDLKPGVPVKEWKTPIKKLNFKRTQEYTAILDNDKDAIETLNKAKDGSLYVINTYENTSIDKGIFEAAKGKDVTLIFEDVDSEDSWNTGIQWIINGLDIKNPKTIDTTLETTLKNNKAVGTNYGFSGVNKDDSLAVKNAFVIEMLTQEPLIYYSEYIKQFDVEKDDFMKLFWEEYKKHEQVDLKFADNGELPAKITIRFKPEIALRNQMPENDLFAYYVKDDQYELIAENIDKDNEDYYSFDITHNSDYVLTPKKMHVSEINEPEKNDPIENVTNEPTKEAGKKNKDSVDTGDHSSTLSIKWISAGVVSLAVITYIVWKRSKEKKHILK